MEYGWICPRCGVVNAPHMEMCKNCLPATDADRLKESRNELLLYYKDLILYWDKFRFTVERRNGDVLNDVAWNEISSWWIAPTLSNDVITIVVKGKSGFLYSFDLDNHSEKSKLFIQDVLRNYCKDKEEL